MTLNLITSRWIPVKRSNDGPLIIRPDEILDSGVIYPDWPRADLNIACLELLIGMMFLAAPPDSDDDWETARKVKPTEFQLREKLTHFASAFNLTGDGPLFLQDFEKLEGEPNPPDMLFIDSAGENTTKNNADLMVRRGRYHVLDLPLAAMALYTLQAHAPSGGAGNRTSMRGGGPMVTLIDPGTRNLWDLIWANIPHGRPADPTTLPWMKPTRTSEAKGSETYPEHAQPAEAFFGMPRRLRLVVESSQVTGVIQRPYGTNYAGWCHPLTPYYRQKEGSELLPVHPKPGVFGFRNWLGVIIEAPGNRALRQRAAVISRHADLPWEEEQLGASVIVAGWAMDNMKPRDFILSHQPLPALTPDSDTMQTLCAMIQSSDSFVAGALRPALKILVGAGETLDSLCESFFIKAQTAFDKSITALTQGTIPRQVITEKWVRDMEAIALQIFDQVAMQELPRQSLGKIKTITEARENLCENFAGRRKPGAERYGELGLLPRQKMKAA